MNRAGARKKFSRVRKENRVEAVRERRTGQCFEPSSCDSQSRAGRRHPTRRTATRRRSLLLSAGGDCKQVADEWAVLLRFKEPPGLRAGPSAHPRSAQPEPDRIEEVNGLLLLQLIGARCIHRWW